MKTVLWQEGIELDPKDPDEEILLEFDWTDRLGGESITGVDKAAENGITVAAFSNTSTKQVIKISAGTPGSFYKVTAKVDTANQHFERSVTVPVRNL